MTTAPTQNESYFVRRNCAYYHTSSLLYGMPGCMVTGGSCVTCAVSSASLQCGESSIVGHQVGHAVGCGTCWLGSTGQPDPSIPATIKRVLRTDSSVDRTSVVKVSPVRTRRPGFGRRSRVPYLHPSLRCEGRRQGLHVLCLMLAATLGLALVDLVGGHSDLPE
jgi:hypothetical protein